MENNVHQALKEAENSLRDFVSFALEARFGNDWVENSGVSRSRIETWQNRKEVEAKRQQSGAVEERLIYYADFYDLRTILKKHWSDEGIGFSRALGGKWKTIEVFLEEMEKLRDPHAHQRELLPHQEQLILGLSGEIRNRIVRYRSEMETGEDYYPRLESLRDNLGNVWVPEGYYYGMIHGTGSRLRVGDTLEFVVSGTDPLGDEVQYQARFTHHTETDWQVGNSFHYTISNEDVGKMCDVQVFVRSPRDYHAYSAFDDYMTFRYEVLPPQ